jgi:nicotinamide riboside kinase
VGDRAPRIAVTGSAGVGKTTLVSDLAARFRVPLVAEGMRARLETGVDPHALGADGFRRFLEAVIDELLGATERAVAGDLGFVADRCAVDAAAFWLYYGYAHDEAGTDRLIERARRTIAGYDLIVVVPWGALPLVADGIRSANPWIQLHYQGLLEGLLRRWVARPRLAMMPPRLTDRTARRLWVERRWRTAMARQVR